MPEFIEAEIVRESAVDSRQSAVRRESAGGRVLNVECEVLSRNSVNIPQSTLNIEPPPPLASCAAQSLDTRHSTLDTPASFENRKSKIGNIAIRPATLADMAFIDKLQKKQSKQVGFFPTQAIVGKIALGHVLVAEVVTSNQGQGASSGEDPASPSLAPCPSALAPISAGYLIGNDQYFKRDDVGCIFQINVLPEYRRSLVAAMLLRAQFERSAYGCKLYCCWCAQDIEANRFWEAMGFVPLAFRTGGKVKYQGRRMKDERNADEACASSFATKARIHIFWQKRIRRGDESTPWWFPCKTGGGSLRADRIVLPIPPGVKWNDPMPTLLPESEERREFREESGRARDFIRKSPIENRKSEDRPAIRMGGMWSAAPAKVKKPKRKTVLDPKLVQAARELRDKWLEQMNLNPNALLPQPRYDVSRALPEIEATLRQLAA